MKKSILLCLIGYLFFASCENNDLDSIVVNKEITDETTSSLKLERFSEILSKAVNDHPSLRTFLKNEALEMVDNDYDVFYPLVKNEIVSEGKTFKEILNAYTNNETELNSLEESLPLLTIYVPELPSGFNAETWNTSEEIPLVAPNVVKQDSVAFYENGNIKFSMEPQLIPGFPVLVVKNNERIQKAGTSLRSGSESGASVGNGYELIDDAFNGNNPELRSIEVGGKPQPGALAYLRDAYIQMGADGYYWQRDNIYYGLTKTTTEGRLNRRLAETIHYIKFSPSAYAKMSDQTGDPAITSKKFRKGTNIDPRLLWTEGRFEIRIDVYVNNISGLGSLLTKYFSAPGDELFNINYKINSSSRDFDEYIPEITSGKAYYPNIKLITWDLASNGSSWKYVISEVDDAETISILSTVTSEFAANASMDTKFGLKFGVSAKKTVSNSYTNVISVSSDDLGTLESNFSDPVALTCPSPLLPGSPIDIFSLYTMSNPMVEMGVMPMFFY